MASHQEKNPHLQHANKQNKTNDMERYCTKHTNIRHTNARPGRERKTTHRWLHVLLDATETRHTMAPKTAKTTKQEPTYANEATRNRIVDPETPIKACLRTNQNQLEYS